jgi:hypothetical protein
MAVAFPRESAEYRAARDGPGVSVTCRAASNSSVHRSQLPVRRYRPWTNEPRGARIVDAPLLRGFAAFL